MVPFAVKKFGFEPDAFVHELVDSIIGDNYPVPDRMLVHNEQIVHEYLHVGDVRQPAPEGQVRPLRGRGRHRRDVLHLQVAEGQSPAQPGRHHRAGRADLHARTSRCRTSRTTTSRSSTSRAPQENRFQFTDDELKKLLTPRSRRSSSSTRAIRTRVALNSETIKKIGTICEESART